MKINAYYEGGAKNKKTYDTVKSALNNNFLVFYLIFLPVYSVGISVLLPVMA
jgi:hypothetical protein